MIFSSWEKETVSFLNILPLANCWRPLTWIKSELRIRRAKALVETYIETYGGTDKMHYVMLFDSWTHMAEVTTAMSTDETWLAFNAASLDAIEPTAILVQSFAGSVLANF